MIATETVLNEVHVRAHAPDRMVNVNVEYNGRPLTEYWADSLLVSTPTGSTAYNLSAGGPIIYPSTQAFAITPVAPSSLSVRSLIIPSTSVCKIMSAVNVPLDLVFDGRITHVLNARFRIPFGEQGGHHVYSDEEYGLCQCASRKARLDRETETGAKIART